MELKKETVGIGCGIGVVLPVVFTAEVPQVASFVTKIETGNKVLRGRFLLRRAAAGQQKGDGEGK